MDIVGRFASERLVFKPAAAALGPDIYRAYVGWCKDNGHNATSSRRFYAEFCKRYGGKVSERNHPRGSLFEGVGVLVGACTLRSVRSLSSRCDIADLTDRRLT